MDLTTLKLVGFKGSIALYTEPSDEGESVKLINKTTDRAVSELIVLSEKTSEEGELFYQVRSAFSQDTGYVLAEDTIESTLAASGVSGYALMQCANCSILKSPDEEYGFYANVNPHVDHPRWSQATERFIGAGGVLDVKRQPTLLFNGYADEVASLYRGLNLRENY